jgi:hypothetical protein
MSIEAMKLALEAFEWNYNTDLDNIPAYEKWAKMLKQNIATLRQAIEQAEQAQPFGYFRYDLRLDAWVQNRAGITGTPFYTTPPQRQHWVSLTDKQLEEMAEKYVTNCYFDTLKYARAVEAELKEKNFVPSKLEAD